jgi:DNA-binding NtrC family response regulator
VTKPVHILIAEDDDRARQALTDLLQDEGYGVTAVADGEAARKLLETPDSEPIVFDALLLDIRMPKLDGLSLLRLLRDREEAPAVLVMTAYGASSIAIEAMKLGAYDYLPKPLRFDELLLQIERALESRRRARLLESYRLDETDSEARLTGSSPAMQEVYKLIGRVAPTESTVLIRGESGTGKELVAREIHHHSKRSGGRFIAINCGAIPAGLIESELFGHEKGAFTGAAQKRIGRFEAAQGGTLFLDEVGDLAPETQVRLLRALQERTIERLGSQQSVRLDVRVIAATHVDLEAAVEEGGFRKDLYYRLNVVSLRLPALRDRVEDIPDLAEALLRKISQRLEMPVAFPTDEALTVLRSRAWPGNVRELEHSLERAAILSRGGPIAPEHLAEQESNFPADPFRAVPLDSGFHAIVRTLESSLITRALDEANGNRTDAAARLGISRRLLYDKLKQLDIT